MERVALVMRLKWIFAFSIISFSTLAYPDAGGAGAPPKEVKQAPPPGPHWEMTFRDASLLKQLLDKNKWYDQFHNSVFYQGAINRIGPVVFSLADDFGVGAKGWKARLIDHLYAKVLENHPVTISYFNNFKFAHPIAITSMTLSSNEKTVIDSLTTIFRSGEDKDIEIAAGKIVKVTPLFIRGQKFAMAFDGGCLSVGRDAKVAALANNRCIRTKFDKKHDGQLTLNLTHLFPALTGVREKFFNAEEEMRLNLKWNASESSFVPTDGILNFSSHKPPILKAKMTSAMTQAVPGNSIFVATGQISRFDQLSVEGIKKYLSSGPDVLRAKKPLAATLFYAPITYQPKETASNDEASDEEGVRIPSSVPPKSQKPQILLGSGLLLQYSATNANALSEISKLFSGKLRGDIYARPVCGDQLVISNDIEVVQLVEQACNKKISSLNELANKVGQAFTKTDFSVVTYFSPGKLLSRYLQKGLEKASVAESSDVEIVKAKKLLEDLNDQVLVGTQDGNKLVMKAL